MDARVFFYDMKNLEPKTKTKILRKLFGKAQKSNFGKYQYQVHGILPEGSYIKPVRSVLIVKRRFTAKVSNLFDSSQIIYKIYDIKVNKREFEK